MRIFSIAALVALLGACDSGSSNAPQDAPERAPDAVTHTRGPPTTEAREETTQTANAPSPLPYGVTAYPGARQIGDSPDFLLKEGKNPRWLQYETTDAPAKVIAFYKAQAANADYSILKETDRKLARSMAIEAARTGGGVMKVDTLEQADGRTMVNVHISEDN